MSREAHVRFWESGRVKIPPATHLFADHFRLACRETATAEKGSTAEKAYDRL